MPSNVLGSSQGRPRDFQDAKVEAPSMPITPMGTINLRAERKNAKNLATKSRRTSIHFSRAGGAGVRGEALLTIHNCIT